MLRPAMRKGCGDVQVLFGVVHVVKPYGRGLLSVTEVVEDRRGCCGLLRIERER